MQLHWRVTYKGAEYEIMGYLTDGKRLIWLELKNAHRTITLQGEKQCRKVKVVTR